jgi:hypothetical protein
MSTAKDGKEHQLKALPLPNYNPFRPIEQRFYQRGDAPGTAYLGLHTVTPE